MKQTFLSRCVGMFWTLVVLFLSAVLTACDSSSGPSPPQVLYDENANAHAEIQDALVKAAQQHKRVLLDFGGNWCADCKVLDYYFHQPPNADLLARNFVLVDIDVGQMDRNIDLAVKYEVPLELGVPALAVLDSRGQLVYSQKSGQFAPMRRMDPASVTSFLEQWKGAAGE